MSTRPPPLPSGVSAYMPRHPGMVERVGRVSGKGWPSLAGSVPCPYHLKEEDEDEEEAGRMAERRGDALWLLFAGDVVARCGDGIALNRTGWPSFPHPVRCCERVRRRAAGDGVDGVDIRRSRREARNWRR